MMTTMTYIIMASEKKSLKIPKRVIRIRKSNKDRTYNGLKKKDKRTNNDQKTLHRKLKIEQHEPH